MALWTPLKSRTAKYVLVAIATIVAIRLAYGTRSYLFYRASLHAYRGELSEARRILSPFRYFSDDARFMLAGMALEEGAFDEASKLVEHAGATDPVEDRSFLLLRELIEQRRRDPSGRWTDVALRAWNAAGRPMLPKDSEPIETSDRYWGQEQVNTASIASLPTAMKFLVDFGESRRNWQHLYWEARREARMTDGTLAVELAALVILVDKRFTQEDREDAQADAFQLLSRVAAKQPDDGYLAAANVVLKSDPEKPFYETELAALETTVKMRTFELPVVPVFEGFKSAYQQVVERDVDQYAFHAALDAVFLDVDVVLKAKARATVDPELQRRAAKVVVAIGERLGAARYMVARFIGVRLEVAGLELLNDASALEVANQKWARLSAVLSRGRVFWGISWAIPGLRRDYLERIVHDEAAYFEAMAGVP